MDEATRCELEAVTLVRPSRKDGSGYTYVITASGYGVKVGHSKTPARRLSQMQVGCPFDLRIAHTWRLTPDGAKHLERQMHAALSWALVKGEWFDILWREAIALGDLFVVGRVDDARELTRLYREQRELDLRLKGLRRAWFTAPGKAAERAAAERAAKAQIPEVERELARNELAAYRLGYWGHNPVTTLAGRNMLAHLERMAA